MNAELFGETIRTLRTEKGLTQKELAAAVGVTDKAVSKWERGKSLPDITLLETLAGVFDRPPGELLEAVYGNNLKESERAEVRDDWSTRRKAELAAAAEARTTAKRLLASAVWALLPMFLLYVPENALIDHPWPFFIVGLVFFLALGVRFGLRSRRKASPLLLTSVLTGIQLIVIAAASQVNEVRFSSYEAPRIFRDFYGGTFFNVIFHAAQSVLSLETYYWEFRKVCIACAVISAFVMFALILVGAAIGRSIRRRREARVS